ncbi:hypothetical protein L249_6693 [Ophiocordyceps polyrhachis-furcata BCC 54312]|uniref:Uncharacterized protein n=1 Tax=Ophiocordyceps polyrhachis-furcata BCC 54312 TaxID=1330021 RepID=A0A367LLI7_9HYPO|nr:hypothetical protein L249_6693 [Ophiocordyceps polyrhachis-furcata BCC 54312]
MPLPTRVLNRRSEIGFTLEYANLGLAIVDFGEYKTSPNALKTARTLINFHSVLAGRSSFSEWGRWLIQDDAKYKRAWFGFSKPTSKQAPSPNADQLEEVERAAKRAGISIIHRDSDLIAEELMKVISYKWGERTVACLEVMMYRQGAFDNALENPVDPSAPAERPELHLPPYLECALCDDGGGSRVLCDLLDRGGNQTLDIPNVMPTKSATEQRACSQYWYAKEQRCIVSAKKLPEFKGRQCWASGRVVECGGGMSASKYLLAKAECYQPAWWREGSATCKAPEPFRFFREIIAGIWPD